MSHWRRRSHHGRGLTDWLLLAIAFLPAAPLCRAGLLEGMTGLAGSPATNLGEQENLVGGGRGSVYGQRPIGGLTERIEGCFDRFDSEYAVQLGRDNINNKRCQAICSDRGFALSATGMGDSCFCGNDYPSIFHRVDTGLCDLPCNPDKASCFSFTCCGSTNQRFFTVSWSAEQDIMLQLLRQLAHDYRFNNPTFRKRVEGSFSNRVTLQLSAAPLSQPNRRREKADQWITDGPPVYLSIGQNGCPVAWSMFDSSCYKVHWAQPSTVQEAVAACQAENGADVATITSSAENAFVKQMLGGCQGWLGMQAVLDQAPSAASVRRLSEVATNVGSTSSGPLFSSLMKVASSVSNWTWPEPPNILRLPSSSVTAPSIHAAWEPVTFTAFKAALGLDSSQLRDEGDVDATRLLGMDLGRRVKDARLGVKHINQLSIRYGDQGVYTLQLKYVLLNGSEAEGPVHGRVPPATLSKTATVDFQDDGHLQAVNATWGLSGLRSVAVVTRRSGGIDVEHGPFGGNGAALGDQAFSSAEVSLPHQVIGMYSYDDAAGILHGFGFYQRVEKDCGATDTTTGKWTHVPCDRVPRGWTATNYVCEKKGGICRLACDPGWVPFAASCYMGRYDRNVTWRHASAACRQLGGHLVSISSEPENELVRALVGANATGYIGWYREPSKRGPWVWDAYSNAPAADRSPGSFNSWKDMTTHDQGRTTSREPQCFSMVRNGSWAPGSCYDKQTRVVICEKGAPDSSCECPYPADVGLDEEGFWHSYGCSCYLKKVVGGGLEPGLSWLEAQAMCGTLGGRLVTIGSKEENDWVHALMRKAMTFNGGFLPGYIGLNNLLDRDHFWWTYYENWSHRTSSTADHSVATDGNWTEAALAAQLMTGNPVGRHQGLSWGGAWTPDKHQGDNRRCAQMARDGSWIETGCGPDHKASCFVCKRCRGGTFPGLRPHECEEWDVEVMNKNTPAAALHEEEKQDPYPWCADCYQGYLRHVNTGQYLGVDAQNWLYMSNTRDPAWCLLTLVVHPKTGQVAILTRHGAALFRDDKVPYLVYAKNLPLPDGHKPHPKYMFPNLKYENWKSGIHNDSSFVNTIFDMDQILCLRTSRMVIALTWRYIRISIMARSRDLKEPGNKECSVAAFDTSPRTVTYECHFRTATPADDLVYFEQEALLFFDQSTFASPRVPLPNGRVRCENQSPTETATCTFAYGQGLTLSRQFRANWGYTISDVITHRINVAPTQTLPFAVMGPGEDTRGFRQRQGQPFFLPRPTSLTFAVTELKEFSNAFSAAYNNFYEILIVKSYVETRNWQLSVPVAPRTTDTIQFWLSSETLQYRWRAMFGARGGFTLSAFGQPIGSQHSLGDLTYFRDLFSFIFGSYEFPYEAEVIITVNDIPGAAWPLPLPEQSQGDRVADVVHNKQFGFG